jgi:hypothetical protein
MGREQIKKHFMKFRDIPQFPHSSYRVQVELCYLQDQLDHWNERHVDLPNHYLILEPDWQRGKVWTQKQQIAFMEYFLKGGSTGRDLYFNCSSWGGSYKTPIYCLDGLQRINTALDFLNNKIPVFGYYHKEFEDKPRNVFHFNVLQIKNKKELLKIYVDFNSGGEVHNPKELKRIEKMIEETDPNETL